MEGPTKVTKPEDANANKKRSHKKTKRRKRKRTKRLPPLLRMARRKAEPLVPVSLRKMTVNQFHL